MAFLKRREACYILIAVLGTVTLNHLLQLYLIRAATSSSVVLKKNATNSSSPREMVRKVQDDPNANHSKYWNPGKILRKGQERLPFPVENTGYLPTAYSTAETCKEKPKYLFFVHSPSGNFHHRHIMRSCLRNEKFSKEHQWATVFFVGLSADNVTAKRVDEEASQNGDVVVLPYKDDHGNLTYKFVYGMKWTIENCPSVKYIVKTNDDFAVDILKVMEYLSPPPRSGVMQFYCQVVTNAYVIRNVTSMWYLSEEVYPNKMYPPYCSGGAIMFDARALQHLYNASFFVPFHGIDDVYVTGEASLIAGVELTEVDNLCSLVGNDVSAVTSRKVMFTKIDDNELRDSAWSSIANALETHETDDRLESYLERLPPWLQRHHERRLERVPPWLRSEYERRLGDLYEYLRHRGDLYEDLPELYERWMRDYDEERFPRYYQPGLRRGHGRKDDYSPW